LRLRKEERVERFAKVNEYRNSFNNKNWLLLFFTTPNDCCKDLADWACLNPKKTR
jgi:predicted HAD superfamily hydrolase